MKRLSKNSEEKLIILGGGRVITKGYLGSIECFAKKGFDEDDKIAQKGLNSLRIHNSNEIGYFMNIKDVDQTYYHAILVYYSI